MRRILFLAALLTLVAAPALADRGDTPPVDVVEIAGPLDDLLADFVIDRMAGSDAQLIVLQVDSPGAVDDGVYRLAVAIEESAVPVAIWVGPSPAVARGGVAQLLEVADIAGVAPGSVVGPARPTVIGRDESPPIEDLADFAEPAEVDSTSELIDVVEPSIGQFIVGLDGAVVARPDGLFELDTAAPVVDDDGVEVIKPLAEVRFVKPDVFTRTLRLSLRPEAVFFFLTAGFAFAVFEFYAAGPGVAAAVAASSLMLAGYGLAVLPIRPLALVAMAFGLVLYVIDFQRNDLRLPSVLGTVALAYGGLTLVDGSGQLPTVWWAIILNLLAVAAFFVFAMTTVVRARFSTQTIGRDHLVGRRGEAVTDLAPDGIVMVDGARWRATSQRAAGIRQGDAVVVDAIDGFVLEVAPEG